MRSIFLVLFAFTEARKLVKQRACWDPVALGAAQAGATHAKVLAGFQAYVDAVNNHPNDNWTSYLNLWAPEFTMEDPVGTPLKTTTAEVLAMVNPGFNGVSCEKGGPWIVGPDQMQGAGILRCGFAAANLYFDAISWIKFNSDFKIVEQKAFFSAVQTGAAQATPEYNMALAGVQYYIDMWGPEFTMEDPIGTPLKTTTAELAAMLPGFNGVECAASFATVVPNNVDVAVLLQCALPAANLSFPVIEHFKFDYSIPDLTPKSHIMVQRAFADPVMLGAAQADAQHAGVVNAFEAYVAAVNNHPNDDWASFYALWADEFTMEDPVGTPLKTTKEEQTAMLAGFAGVQCSVRGPTVVAGDKMQGASVLTCGFPAVGLEFHAIEFFTVNPDGKIKAQQAFVSHVDLGAAERTPEYDLSIYGFHLYVNAVNNHQLDNWAAYKKMWMAEFTMEDPVGSPLKTTMADIDAMLPGFNTVVCSIRGPVLVVPDNTQGAGVLFCTLPGIVSFPVIEHMKFHHMVATTAAPATVTGGAGTDAGGSGGGGGGVSYEGATTTPVSASKAGDYSYPKLVASIFILAALQW